MALYLKLFAAPTALAAAAFVSAPASAAEIPAQAQTALTESLLQFPGTFNAEELEADRHRRYRHRGYRYRGYGRRGFRHRRGSRAGDILTGVLIVGGIAAIASAASKSKRRDYEERSRDYREGRDDSRRESRSGRGIDRAVDMCLETIERDVRVEEVEGVDRTGEGWRVTGTIFNGDQFVCTIGPDGKIDDVSYGDSFAELEIDEDAERRSEQTAAYPGGPVDGDLEAEAEG